VSEGSGFPSAPQSPDSHPAGPRGAVPPSIDKAVQAIWGLIGLAVLNALITFVMREELIAQRRANNPSIGEVSDASILVSAVLSVVLFGGLYLLLASFLRQGARWARIVLTVLAGLALGSAAISIFTGSTPLLLVMALTTAALTAALLWFLWQQDSSAYMRAQRRRG